MLRSLVGECACTTSERPQDLLPLPAGERVGVRGVLLQYLPNLLKYSVEICQDVIVPESDDSIPITLQHQASELIVANGIHVLATV